MNIYTIIVLVLTITLALIPAINFNVPNPQGDTWVWMILIAGFFGMLTLFVKKNWVVKTIAVLGFFYCFFSCSPNISFTAYVSLIICCWLYICALRIKNWSYVFKALQAVLFLNVLMLCMQYFHKDDLLNFGATGIDQYVITGHHMQSASYSIILSSFLLPFSSFNFLFPIVVSLFCHSSWSFLTALSAAIIYWTQGNKIVLSVFLAVLVGIFCWWSIKDNKFEENLNKQMGRAGAWEKAFELANKRPLTGWGPGTFKLVFYPLSGMLCQRWTRAHNFIIQLLFEVGYPATIAILIALGCLLNALFKYKQWILLSGWYMILMDGMVHFPDRMMQTMPIIVLFLAYTKVTLMRAR